MLFLKRHLAICVANSAYMWHTKCCFYNISCIYKCIFHLNNTISITSSYSSLLMCMLPLVSTWSILGLVWMKVGHVPMHTSFVCLDVLGSVHSLVGCVQKQPRSLTRWVSLVAYICACLHRGMQIAAVWFW